MRADYTEIETHEKKIIGHVIAWKENGRNAIVHKKIRGSEYIFGGEIISMKERREEGGIIRLPTIIPIKIAEEEFWWGNIYYEGRKDLRGIEKGIERGIKKERERECK
ncbi:MAG: hypothetical protein DRN49_00080 [Thaumarchaeota archaeon]|mgnify:CR=1 FL=1|nr:MAG: hypothetical protein DRN49_00080 [Nitrososphaerota archaeon]